MWRFFISVKTTEYKSFRWFWLDERIINQVSGLHHATRNKNPNRWTRAEYKCGAVESDCLRLSEEYRCKHLNDGTLPWMPCRADWHKKAFGDCTKCDGDERWMQVVLLTKGNNYASCSGSERCHNKSKTSSLKTTIQNTCVGSRVVQDFTSWIHERTTWSGSGRKGTNTSEELWMRSVLNS